MIKIIFIMFRAILDFNDITFLFESNTIRLPSIETRVLRYVFFFDPIINYIVETFIVAL